MAKKYTLEVGHSKVLNSNRHLPSHADISLFRKKTRKYEHSSLFSAPSVKKKKSFITMNLEVNILVDFFSF